MRGSLSRETDQRTALTRLKRARACSLGSLPHLLNEFLPNKRRTPFLFVTTLPQLGFCVDKLSESIISSLPLSLFLLRARALSFARSSTPLYLSRVFTFPRRRRAAVEVVRVPFACSAGFPLFPYDTPRSNVRARTGALSLSRPLVRAAYTVSHTLHYAVYRHAGGCT